MLRGLTVRNIVLVEAAEISFAPGLNVLTGETGAGKSILLDALGFALGARPRGPLLRAGARHGEVTAEFDLVPGHPAHAILAGAGLPQGDELVLRRIVDADGRSRAFANDGRCGPATLQALARTLVEVHGRQDEGGLLDSAAHRGLLDAFAGDPAPLAAMRSAWATLASARRALAGAGAGQEAAARDADLLSHAVAELRRLAPQPGEEAALDAARRRMRAADRVGEEVAKAMAALGAEGAEGRMSDAARRLAAASGAASGAVGALLDAPVAALERAMGALSETLAGLDAALAGLDTDPLSLERTEERLFALREMARKHRVPADTLPDLAARFAARLALVEDGEAALTRAREAVQHAEVAAAAAAEALGRQRLAAASRLEAAMAQELPPLRLDRARFEVRVEAGEPGTEGSDRVRFGLATAAGAEPGPLERVASGGELSRVLLALKVCLAGRRSDLTLVFDEIDRGVGGATAEAVGRRLAALAAGGQVLAVTHSPQVAARGEHHWRIEKRDTADGVRTAIEPLEAAAREGEIARMLSGERITPEARAQARTLLAG